MVYNSENRASLQKLPDKSQLSGKRQWILLLRKYSSRLDRALSTIGAGRRARQTARAVEEMFMRKLPRTS